MPPAVSANGDVYDLDKDISETKDLAPQHPGIVHEMKQIAETEHEPMVTGTFSSKERHLKDRYAKSGGKPPAPKKKRKPKK